MICHLYETEVCNIFMRIIIIPKLSFKTGTGKIISMRYHYSGTIFIIYKDIFIPTRKSKVTWLIMTPSIIVILYTTT